MQIPIKPHPNSYGTSTKMVLERTKPAKTFGLLQTGHCVSIILAKIAKEVKTRPAKTRLFKKI